MSKKALSLIAMIVSVLIIFFGILVMAGSLGGDTSMPGSGSFDSSLLYDSGYAEFGADFYTYVSNNAAAAAEAAESAASAARTVAYNLHDIALLLKNVCGIFLIGFGLLSFCHFGLIRIDAKKDEETVVEAPVSEVVPLPEPAAEQEADAEQEA